MRSKKIFLKISLLAIIMLALPGLAFLNIQEKQPKVLLIGDSISIGYLPFVQEIMKGKVAVDRIPLKPNGKAENCQGTTNGIANIDRWLGDTKWDVIHFNFGLHDIKHIKVDSGKNSNDPNDPHQADLKQYKKNLSEIVAKLKATGAKLIFATTTPYPKGTKPYRAFGDDIKYNKVAKKIMKKNGIAVNDLHAFVFPRMEQLQKPVNVHFTELGSKALAEQVVQSISENLNKK
jgi:lysophospholipase L1-like esterase